MTSNAQLDLYADATLRRKKASANHVGWPLAAMKALEGLGIRHQPDVKRLTPLILRRLEERGDKPKVRNPQPAGAVTPEEAARAFNNYLAGKHMRAYEFGESYRFNFAELSAEVDRFRITYFPRLSSDQVPEVHEIVKELRRLWGIKTAATRHKRARAQKRRPVDDRQLQLF